MSLKNTGEGESNKEGEDLAVPLPATLDLKTAKITLYASQFSFHSAKVRALLHYYDIPFEEVRAEPNAPIEGLDPSYGKLPKLKVNDTQINDSAIIFKQLAPLLTGKPMSGREELLEASNNIKGLTGAIVVESFCSYRSMANVVMVMGADKHFAAPVTNRLKAYSMAFLSPMAWGIKSTGALDAAGYGSDGTTSELMMLYKGALADKDFLSGDAIGPLDLSVYASWKLAQLFSQPCFDKLADKGLKEWFDRVDKLMEGKGEVMPTE